MPPDEEGLDWEGEVVAWVGDTLADAEPDEALAAVVGYSAFNDPTARRAQKQTSQWVLGKNADRRNSIVGSERRLPERPLPARRHRSNDMPFIDR